MKVYFLLYTASSADKPAVANQGPAVLVEDKDGPGGWMPWNTCSTDGEWQPWVTFNREEALEYAEKRRKSTPCWTLEEVEI